MKITTLAAGLAALPLVLTLSATQADSAELPAGRFQLLPAGPGFVRLDTATGALSLCQIRNEVLLCGPASEAVITGSDAASAVGKAPSAQGSSDPAELDRTLSTMDKVMRHMYGLMQEFRADDQKRSPEAGGNQALPQKT